MTKVTEKDVYLVLYQNERWMSPLQIMDDLRESKGVAELLDGAIGFWSAFRAFWKDIPLHSVHKHLVTLVEKDYAMERERQLTPKQLASRGGRRGWEYSLTIKGLDNSPEYLSD